MPPEPLYIEAARAVREYARQLRSLHIKIVGADQGKRVLDRFLYALQVELFDDDIRFSDDTPVEFVSAQGSRNAGHIAGASRDESLLYVAFEFEVLPVDMPGWLQVSRSQTFLNLAEYLAHLTTPPSLAVALNSEPLQTTPLQNEDSQVVARDLQQTQTP